MWKEASKPSMPKISWICQVVSIQYWLVMDRRTNRQTVGHMTIANTMLAQRHVVKKLFSASNCYDRRTSCCSTESKRLHCCCHLPNTHQMFLILYNVTGDVLQIAPSNGANCPHLVHGSLGPPDSKPQMAPRLVQLFL